MSETAAMGITYREPSERDLFGDYAATQDLPYVHENASGAERIVTVQEPVNSTLGAALVKLILRDLDRTSYWSTSQRILVTTEGWWSGYSEYTVTSTWETVVVTCPERNWERRWETPAALFADLAKLES